MSNDEMTAQPPPGTHRRRNPLTGRWVLVSAERSSRPWHGRVEPGTADDRPPYDPGCYLCPGNVRTSGKQNPDYRTTHVFTNDFPALSEEPDEVEPSGSPLLLAESVAGTCRVVCYSPRHDLTMANMDVEGIGGVVDIWVDQIVELGRDHRWVQVFENSGAAMGASIPHPHGQIWATSKVPTEVDLEDRYQQDHYREHGSPMLIDYLDHELDHRSRIVVENEDWAAVVPYWAVWPFETLLVPRWPVCAMPDLNSDQRLNLSRALKELLTRYDRLFSCPFPYSMGWHSAPSGDSDGAHWQLHAHFYPPLLRSPTIRKHMVGFELLSESQRDLTAEQAAERLRASGVAAEFAT